MHTLHGLFISLIVSGRFLKPAIGARCSSLWRQESIQCVEVNDSKIQTLNRLGLKHHTLLLVDLKSSGVAVSMSTLSYMVPNHSFRRLNNTGNNLGYRALWGLFFTLTCRVFVSVCVSSERMRIRNLSPGTDFMTARMYYCIHSAVADDFIIPFIY